MPRPLVALALVALALVAFALPAVAEDKPKDTKLYELKVYTAEKGKLDAVHALGKDHALKLFAKHGVETLGVWVPIKNDDEKIYILVAYKDKEARAASIKAFSADEEWVKAATAATKDGMIIKKIEEYLLTPTDFSPPVKAEKGKEDRVFELRWYTATKGNLDALDARFRDHTLKLFEKYGMTNLPYFHLAKGEKGDDTALVYMLAHKSEDAAKKSFDEFRKDADWVKAKDESEKKAGGSLTEAKDGVKSVFLKATDYSPTK